MAFTDSMQPPKAHFPLFLPQKQGKMRFRIPGPKGPGTLRSLLIKVLTDPGRREGVSKYSSL